LIPGDRVTAAQQWLIAFSLALQEWECQQEPGYPDNTKEIVAPPTAPTDDVAACCDDDYDAQVQRAITEGSIPDFLRRQEEAQWLIADLDRVIAPSIVPGDIAEDL
jgi:hypothetical protein